MSNEKETPKQTEKETPKVVVLNEDMNGHKFDDASYEKLMNEQKNIKK